MTVADINLCRELYTLSNWTGTDYEWVTKRGETELWDFTMHSDYETGGETFEPAYDLGYLLRKLPVLDDPDFGDEIKYEPTIARQTDSHGTVSYFAAYYSNEGEMRLWGDWSEVGISPEDAACKLAIELFKKGVLQHD